ncbi:hypothetical protein GCM10009504_08570 [Pseudomonas laurentiana]|nr:hypothetical protein GCM10009504_08570 [Pseudomonas laurentiana]
MDGHWFFPYTGDESPRFRSPEQLTELVYDLAWFWKVNPNEVMNWPLDQLFESEENAWRIQAMLGGGNGG